VKSTLRLVRRILGAAPEPPMSSLVLGNGESVPVVFVRNLRARRYILRLRPDRSARVTVPRGGSLVEARRFAERQRGWLERQIQGLSQRVAEPRAWLAGASILFRGEPAFLRVDPATQMIQFADQSVSATTSQEDLRPAVERHLWALATRELPPRVWELAEEQGLRVNRVTVRNQRSRWGSCSRNATISLNWRILQAPDHVRDYLVLHELMHLRQMNHSAKYWKEVAKACPDYLRSELWLKEHNHLLR
jgi:predicted metal-dependent hydrolase